MRETDFGNSLNWDLVRRQDYAAKPSIANPDELLPIPPISFVLSAPYLLIGINSVTAKPHWFLGCRASLRLLISPSSLSEFAGGVEVLRKNCGLKNLTLIEASEVKPKPYLLMLFVPWWHEKIEIEVWEYSGVDTDKVLDQLGRIESKLGDTSFEVEIAENND